jgi:hypothetical protein
MGFNFQIQEVAEDLDWIDWSLIGEDSGIRDLIDPVASDCEATQKIHQKQKLDIVISKESSHLSICP